MDIQKLTIEPHGDGYAIYVDRDMTHHGFNVAQLTEVDPRFPIVELIAEIPSNINKLEHATQALLNLHLLMQDVDDLIFIEDQQAYDAERIERMHNIVKGYFQARNDETMDANLFAPFRKILRDHLNIPVYNLKPGRELHIVPEGCTVEFIHGTLYGSFTNMLAVAQETKPDDLFMGVMRSENLPQARLSQMNKIIFDTMLMVAKQTKPDDLFMGVRLISQCYDEAIRNRIVPLLKKRTSQWLKIKGGGFKPRPL